jgi:hypothetical protein
MRETWNYEKIQQEALKFQKRNQFKKQSPRAYNAARKRRVLDLVCKHMDNKPRSWNSNSIALEARKYKSRIDFLKNSKGAYNAARRLKILDDVCKHMKPLHEKWDLQKILEISILYDNIITFMKKEKRAYQAARYQGILKKVCKHMKRKHIKWNIKKIKKEALKYSNRNQFQKSNPNAYEAARRHGCVDEVCAHMKPESGSSSLEKELRCEIKRIFPNSTKLVDRRAKIQGKPYIRGFDIDIYVPELKKGIEFDGKYWHSIKMLARGRKKWPMEDLEKYHEIKDNYFKNKGIDILHITEEEWRNQKEVCIQKCFDFFKKG